MYAVPSMLEKSFEYRVQLYRPFPECRALTALECAKTRLVTLLRIPSLLVGAHHIIRSLNLVHIFLACVQLHSGYEPPCSVYKQREADFRSNLRMCIELTHIVSK